MAFEITQHGGLGGLSALDGYQIRHAVICDPQRRHWHTLPREAGESERVFQQRVRLLCADQDAQHICWGGQPAEWSDDD